MDITNWNQQELNLKLFTKRGHVFEEGMEMGINMNAQPYLGLFLVSFSNVN